MQEVYRTLRLGGFGHITLPHFQRDSAQRSDAMEVEPHTYMVASNLEKDIPHHLFTEEKARELVKTFKLVQLQEINHSHYGLPVRKPSAEK